MRAARRFVEELEASEHFDNITRVSATFYGSLGLTGKGHGTDKALILGLAGQRPESVDPAEIDSFIESVRSNQSLKLIDKKPIEFDDERDLTFDRKVTWEEHPNAMKLVAWDAAGNPLLEKVYFSVGGGFVIEQAEFGKEKPSSDLEMPFPFTTGKAMLAMAKESGLSISQMVWQNEQVRKPKEQLRQELLSRWQVMRECVDRGCRIEGVLPGGLKVQRRAPDFFRKLSYDNSTDDPLTALDWVDVYALAVSEENAAGGRVVTAPTNGAAGIIPAVLHYFVRYHKGDDDGVVRFLLVAGAIAILYKENASLSGAEVGCQGEVGVACSMAAGALTEVLGGRPIQVEQAAEIGMEHNLGLTCDPVGGLVQVPCIERNAMGAVKAINAARLALRGTGEHRISLDRVIDTMRRTGADMSSKYKETSRGGLAVNIAEC